MKTTLTLMNSVNTLNSGAWKTIGAKYFGLIFCLLTLSFYAQAQTTIVSTLGNVSGCPGQDVLVPLNVTNFDSITSISIKITYDTSNLTALGVLNLNSATAGSTYVPNIYVDAATGVGYVAISLFKSTGTMTIGSGLLCNIKFHVKNKTSFTNLMFNTQVYGDCEYSDQNYVPISNVSWINGSVYTEPAFSVNSSIITILPGGNGYFFVQAMGNNTYQWQLKPNGSAIWSNLSTGSPYGDVTNDTLFLTNVTIGMNGNSYRVIATNISGGCAAPYNVSISNPALLTVAASCPTVFTVTGGGSYCAGGAGVHVFLSGSEVGVSYQLKHNGVNVGGVVAGTGSALDFGAQTVAGTYTVTGSNANICSPITMNLNAVVAIYATTNGSISGGITVCGGVVTPLTLSLNGFQPFDVIYSDGTSQFALNNINTNYYPFFVSPTVTTTYTLISAINGHGCNMTITGSPAVITVKPTPTAVASSNSPVCSGNTINLSSAGSADGISYTWTFNSNPLSGPNPSIPNATTANSGIYTLTASGSNGCTAIATTNVTVNTTPGGAGAISGTASVCKLTSYTYNVGTIAGATTYNWTLPAGASITSGSGTNSIVVLFSVSAVSGNITVLGQSDCGDGTVSANFPVTVNNTPVASASNTGPVCAGAALNLASSGGTSYLWSGPNGFNSTLQNPSFSSGTTPALTGQYTVTVTNAATCSSTAVTTATVNANPVASAGSNSPVCTGSFLSLTSSGGNSYTWSGPNSFTSTLQNPTLPVVVAGAYTVTITNTLTTCHATAVANVTVNLAPSITVSDNDPCESSTLNLSASGGVSYSWSGPNAFTSTLQNPTISNVTTAAGGTYSVLVTGANSCTAIGTTLVNIKLNPSPISASSNSPVCAGSTINFAAFGGVSYTWNGPNTFAASVSNPSILNASAINAGSYVLTVTGGNGCTATSTTGVIVNAKPIANAGADQIININQTALLTGSASAGSGTYSWNWQPSAFLGSNNVQNPTTLALAATTTFTLIATDLSTNCVSNADTVIVNVNQSTFTIAITTPSVPPGQSWVTITEGGSVVLEAQVSNGTGPFSYEWSSLPPGFASTFSNPTVAPLVTTTYYVTVTDLGAAPIGGPPSIQPSAIASFTVYVEPLPTSSILVYPGTIVCSGSTIDFYSSVTGGSGNYTYSWSGPNGFTSTLQNPIIDNVTFAAAGFYSLTIFDGTNYATATPVNITVNLGPALFAISSGGSYCQGTSGFAIELLGSEIGTTYQLLQSNNPLGLPIAGTGNVLPLGTHTAELYTVQGTNICGTVDMTGSAVITESPLPATFFVNGGGMVCSGSSVNIEIGGSEIGATYNVYLDGIITSMSFAGTGSIITFTVYDPGNYTVVAVNSCGPIDMSGYGYVYAGSLPTHYNVQGGGTFCLGNTGIVSLAGSETNATYQLYLGGAPVGAPITGTGEMLDFIVSAVGTYTIGAQNNCGNTFMDGDATFSLTTPPAVFGMTGGTEGPSCTITETPVGLDGSEPGVVYTLFLDGVNTGNQAVGTGSSLIFGLFTDPGTYTAIAAYSTDCSTNMSGSVAITLLPSPVILLNPVNANVVEGGNTSFTVSAASTSTYLWSESTDGGLTWTPLTDGGIYSGTSTPTLHLNGVLLSMNNNLYRSTLAEGVCVAITNSASLNVIPAGSVITCSLDQLTLCPGEIVVPIHVTNYFDVAAASLVMNFNPSVLTYTGYQNVNPGLNDPGTLLVNSTNGTILISHYTLTPSNIGTGILLELLFQYNGGNTYLNWDLATPGNCQFSDFNDNTLATMFFSGSITQNGTTAVINNNPVNTTVNPGDNAAFHVAATGAFSYQWQTYTSSWVNLADGALYSGTQTADLLINGVTVGMNGSQYRVIVRDLNCQTPVYSNMATLSVTSPTLDLTTTAPNVTACGGNQVIVPVSVANLSNVAAISLRLNYDPAVASYVNIQNLNPAFTPSEVNIYNLPGDWRLSWYSLTPVSISSGNLVDIVFDYYGGTTNLTWDLSIPGFCEYDDFDGNIIPSVFIDGSITPSGSQPMITGQPVNTTVNDGDNASFTVVAANVGTYQWQISVGGSPWTNLSNSGIYSGVNSATLNITPAVITMNNYNYRVVLNSGNCTTTSNVAVLYVTPLGGTIITTAANITACPGMEITVPVGVQYLYNVAAISLTLNYDPSVITYLTYDNLNPQLALGTVTIYALPGLWKFSWYSLAPMSLGSGNLFDLIFTYNGGSSDLTWDIVIPGNCEYDDFNGNILASAYVNGHVGPSVNVPTITGQPADLTVTHHDNAEFHVVANPGASFQWQISTNGGASWTNLSNGGHYSGATTPDLFITNALYLFNGYQYRSVVSMDVCYANSNAATLTVLPILPFTVTTIAPNINVCPGTDIVIPINVTDFYSVAANSLTMNYDNSVITYTGFQNLNPAMADALLSPTPGQFKFSWYSLTPLSLGDATIVELLFHYNGGSTNLTWDLATSGNNEYNDFDGNIMPSAYINGTVGSSALAPVIITQPAGVVSFIGAPPVTFNVDVNFATSYQWQVSSDGGTTWSNLADVAPYSGVNTSTLTIATLSIDMNGNQYRAFVEGTCTLNATSNAATLTVYSLIITTAGSVTECASNPIIVPITVQHLYDVGAISLTLNYNSAELTYVGYQDVNPALDPSLLIVNASGGQVKIGYSSVVPLNFGDGQLLSLIFSSAGTSSNLVWDNVTPGNSEYLSFTTSAVINSQYVDGSLLVHPLTVITSNPVSVNLDEGNNTFFDVTADNATSYQWQVSVDGGITWTDLVDNAVYSGVTTNHLVLTGFTYDMNGNLYHAVASGLCATAAVSSSATLNATPVIRTIAGDVVSCAGNSILVPITVEHLYGVAAMSLSLNYNDAVLTYVGFQDVNPLIDANFLLVNAYGGQVKIGYFNINPLNIGNGLVLNVIFSSTGGSSALTWDNLTTGNCEYINSAGGIITSQYVNGSVLVNPLPVITFDNIGPFCIDGGAVTLTALPLGGTFSGNGVSEGIFDPAAAGIGTWAITYTYTDELGCIGTKIIEVVVNPLPIVIFDPAGPFCLNSAAGTLVGHPSGGTFSGPGIVGNTFNPALTGLGTFTLTYTYADANGCVNSATTDVVVNSIPVVTFDPIGPFCSNADPIVLSGSPAGGTFSGAGVSGNEFNPSIAGPGTWVLTYTYSGGNGCDNSASITVVVNAIPTPFPVFGGGEYCVGGTGLNVGTGGSQAGFQYYLYLNGNNTGQMLIGTGSILNFGLQLLPGTYTIYAMNPGGTGCNNWLDGSVTITVNPLPNVYGGGYTIICQGTSTTINAVVTGGTSPYLYNWTPANSLSSPFVLNPVASPSVTTFYQVVVTDSKGCSASDNALVVVNAAPIISAGPDKVINIGMTTPLNASVSGGHAPYTYLWTPATGLNSANVLVPLASPIVTTTYTLVVTDNVGCSSSDQVTVTVTSTLLGYNINGFVTYDNIQSSPMTNTNVLLKQNNVVVNTTVTDIAGSYGFTLIPNGLYTITGNTNKPWGGGNSIDAYLMAKFFVDPANWPLTGLRLLAGDLNGDGIVNAADALLVMRRSVFLINSFPVGDWIFETKIANVNNGNLTIDFKALCYGDVNRSNIPALKVSPSVSLNMEGSIAVENNKEFELPIRAGENLNLGAASLVVRYPANAIEILDVMVSGNSQTSNLVYSLQDDNLLIGWYNLNPLTLAANDVLFTLKVKIKDITAIENMTFSIEGESQMAEANGNVLPAALLTIPKLHVINVAFSLGDNYPNPFNQFTTISYTTPENGNVNLSVYNMIGEKVAELVRADQNAGSYSVTMDGTILPAGVYTYRLRVEGTTQTFDKSKRMIISR